MSTRISSPPIQKEIAVPAQTGSWAALTDIMRRQPFWLAILSPTLLTFLMGWLDDVTGWEVSLFIFYAIPIVLAVWWSGSTAGFAISILSGIVWWMANNDVHPYVTELGYIWALVNREFYFCVVVFAVNAIRNRQDSDAAHIHMLEERRQLEKDIVSVSEHEQQRIGRDLHDGLCQQLAAIGCAVRALTEDLHTKGLESASDAAQIEESLQQAVVEARDLARGIFPVHVDRSGLSAALRDLAQMTSRLTGTSIEVQENSDLQLDSPEASMHLYRIAQEAVANAVRHGQAKNIQVKVELNELTLNLIIEDDGKGMDFRAIRKAEGMGLRTMRYRAQAIGAELHFEPRLGGGTRIRCQLKIEHESDNHSEHHAIPL
jgi:signal transduction histidine kinase